MNVLVTGGRGFVGLNIARTLAEHGASVWIADRGPVDRWVETFLENASSIRHLTVDLSVNGQLDDALTGVMLDAVVHAAVVTATTETVEREQARDIIDSNVGGTIEALDVAAGRGARRFIYVSSPSAIGDVPSDGPVAEDVIPKPGSLYGITKLASEQIVSRWADIHELETASVRIAQPYGPGERATTSRIRTSPIWEWLRDAGRGEPLPTGPLDRARDWTFVEDTAGGVARMVTADSLPHRLYHLGTGSDVTVADVLRALESRYGALDHDLDPPADALNPNISGPGRSPLDVRRFAGDFDWQPRTTIADGMQHYFDWWEGFRRRVGDDVA